MVYLSLLDLEFWAAGSDILNSHFGHFGQLIWIFLKVGLGCMRPVWTSWRVSPEVLKSGHPVQSDTGQPGQRVSAFWTLPVTSGDSQETNTAAVDPAEGTFDLRNSSHVCAPTTFAGWPTAQCRLKFNNRPRRSLARDRYSVSPRYRLGCRR